MDAPWRWEWVTDGPRLEQGERNHWEIEYKVRCGIFCSDSGNTSSPILLRNSNCLRKQCKLISNQANGKLGAADCICRHMCGYIRSISSLHRLRWPRIHSVCPSSSSSSSLSSSCSSLSAALLPFLLYSSNEMKWNKTSSKVVHVSVSENMKSSADMFTSQALTATSLRRTRAMRRLRLPNGRTAVRWHSAEWKPSADESDWRRWRKKKRK